jgi:hypothetical protein
MPKDGTQGARGSLKPRPSKSKRLSLDPKELVEKRNSRADGADIPIRSSRSPSPSVGEADSQGRTLRRTLTPVQQQAAIMAELGTGCNFTLDASMTID